MIAGFLPLFFSPQAWVVVGLTALLSFGGGVVKGWNASNADQWRKVAEAAQQAAKDKERISDADRVRADAAEAEMARLDAALQGVIHDANAKATSCKLAPGDIERLRVLSGANRKRGG